VDVGVADCNPPKYLTGAQTSANPPEVTLQWKNPNTEGVKWVEHCKTISPNTGIGGEVSMLIAARFFPSDLAGSYADLDGLPIAAFRFYPREKVKFTLHIWQGGDGQLPGDLVFNKIIQPDDIVIKEWNEVLLDFPLFIDITKALWIGYTFSNSTGSKYPIGVDQGPQVAGKGNLIYWDEQWKELTDIGTSLTYNWLISVLVEKPTAKSGELSGKGANLTKYDIYRDDDLIKTMTVDHLPWVSFTDNTISAGKTYNYCVVAKYDDDCETYPNCILVETAGCNPPKNLTATQTATNPPEVTLTWDIPTKLLITRWDAPRIRAGVLNYLVYRDNVLVETLPSDKLTWKDHNVTANETYNYCVVARYGDDCESAQNALCKEITVTSTAVGEMENNIVIYPNPTTGQLRITNYVAGQARNDAGITNIEIFDMMGKSVIQFVTLNLIQDNYSTEIDLRQFPAGMYMMRITIGDETTSRKIIKSER
jgi:hypothetical protein